MSGAFETPIFYFTPYPGMRVIQWLRAAQKLS